MSAYLLFCPGSNSNNAKSKAGKSKRFNFRSTSPVDPLYDTIPFQTKFSESNRGRHSFDQTGQLPPSMQQTHKLSATVLSNHSPVTASGQCQELSVVSGDTVHVLHQEQGWSYVVDKVNRMGYVPSEVLVVSGEEASSTANTGTTFRSETIITNPHPSPATPTESVYSKVNKQRRARSASQSSISNRILSPSPLQNRDNFHNSFATFSKSPREVRTLLYSFMPAQENDLTVRKGEQVTVLNNSDPDWLWVVRGDGDEGFLPTSYTAPASSYVCGNGSIASQPKHSKLTKQHSYSSTGYRSSSSVTNSNNQLSAAFSDHLRVTPVRSLPHSPVDGDLSYLQASSEPTVEKHRPNRQRKSPERTPSRQYRSRTPNSFTQKRANSLDYIDKKHPDTLPSNPTQLSEAQRQQRHCKSPNTSQFYHQPIQRPTRPAPSPPEDCIYQNLNLVYPNPLHTHQYPQFHAQTALQENIYVNTIQVDANGKPSLVPSIMTMHDRIQLLDRTAKQFPHSPSDYSLGATSSLGDINSVSEFNQHYLNNRMLKEDMV